MVQYHSPPFCLPATDIELVLAAGGINGFRHLGVIEELEAQGIPIGTVTGVSVGAIVAAFYTNGYTPDETSDIFLQALEDNKDPISVIIRSSRQLGEALHKIGNKSLAQDPIAFFQGGWLNSLLEAQDAVRQALQAGTDITSFLRSLSVPDPISFAIGGCVDLLPLMREMVRRYDLKPRANLRIVGADLFKQTLVGFEGEDYDLAHKLALACALPKVFRPQWDTSHGGLRLMGDGATVHYSPAEFCKGAAIFSTFRPSTEVPAHIDNWLYLFFSLSEIYCPLAGNHRYVDAARHLVIETGDQDVAGLNFGIGPDRCRKMRSDARLVARAALQRAREEGRLANLPGK